MTQPTITRINPAKVVHSYSGRPGCGCGCRGKHSYRDKGEDRSVDTVVKNMNKMVAAGEAAFEYQDNMVFIETPTRYYWAYFS